MKKVLLFLAFCSLTSSGIASSFAMDKNQKPESNLEENLVLYENNQKITRNSFLISQVGGGGGTEYKLPPKGRISEIIVSAGDVVDGIEVIYDNSPSQSQKAGGEGGYNCPITISSNEYIKAMEVKYGSVIDSIRFGLAEIDSNNTITRWTTPCGGEGGFSTFTFTARDNEAITGFKGKAGIVIDSIEAIYGAIQETQ